MAKKESKTTKKKVTKIPKKKVTKTTKKSASPCGPGTHYDVKTNSCILDKIK